MAMAPKIEPSAASVADNGGSHVSGQSRAPEESSIAQRMLTKLTFIPEPSTKKKPIFNLLKKIPLLTGFLSSVDRAGHSLSNLAQIEGDVSEVLKNVMVGYQFAGLTLVIIDFLRIPIIFAAAAIYHEKLPFTLSKKAKWAYSAVLLGLTITALSLPFTAVPIALTMASLGLVSSLFTMGKILKDQYQLRAKLKSIKNDIALETAELNGLHAQAVDLENLLHEAESKKDNTAQAAALRTQLGDIKHKFDKLLDNNKSAKLQSLYNQQFQCEEKLKRKGLAAVMDRGVAVSLASLAVIGIAISIFFPPIGLGMVAATAILGAVYIVGRITIPLITSWITGKFNKKTGTSVSDKPAEPSEIAPEHLPTPDPPANMNALDSAPTLPQVGSTTTIKQLLDDKEAVKPVDEKAQTAPAAPAVSQAPIPQPAPAARHEPEDEDTTPHAE